MTLLPQKQAYIIALMPIVLAVLSALAVVELAGPGFTNAVNQSAILMRFLWAIIFPLLMIPFVFWARRVAKRHSGVTLFAVIILIAASWLNYGLLG